MPRIPRIKSSTGIYHVTMRGVNKSNIFIDNEDYETFLNYLQNIKNSSSVQIFAYCLMTNHIHLLLKEVDEELGLTFQRLGAGFVGWYNRKYDRLGHLFQSRYGSEAVETDAYLLMVMRYIHQNPVKAGLARSVAEYPWSSIHEFAEKSRVCNTRLGLEYFGEPDSLTARRDFLLAQEYEVSGVQDPDDLGERKPDSWQMDQEDVLRSFSDSCQDRNWEDRNRLSQDELLRWAIMLRRYGASWNQIKQETGVSRYLLTKFMN